MPRMYRLCLALTRDAASAEDLLQASVLRAYERRESFAARGSFAGWLFRIIRREQSERARTEARRRTLFEAARERWLSLVGGLSLGPCADPEEWICASVDANTVLDCLRSLPETYRVVLFLCDVEELTHAEAAEALNVPIGTIKSRQARGRRLLRRAFERPGGAKRKPE